MNQDNDIIEIEELGCNLEIFPEQVIDNSNVNDITYDNKRLEKKIYELCCKFEDQNKCNDLYNKVNDIFIIPLEKFLVEGRKNNYFYNSIIDTIGFTKYKNKINLFNDYFKNKKKDLNNFIKLYITK